MKTRKRIPAIDTLHACTRKPVLTILVLALAFPAHHPAARGGVRGPCGKGTGVAEIEDVGSAGGTSILEMKCQA